MSRLRCGECFAKFCETNSQPQNWPTHVAKLTCLQLISFHISDPRDSALWPTFVPCSWTTKHSVLFLCSSGSRRRDWNGEAKLSLEGTVLLSQLSTETRRLRSWCITGNLVPNSRETMFLIIPPVLAFIMPLIILFIFHQFESPDTSYLKDARSVYKLNPFNGDCQETDNKFTHGLKQIENWKQNKTTISSRANLSFSLCSMFLLFWRLGRVVFCVYFEVEGKACSVPAVTGASSDASAAALRTPPPRPSDIHINSTPQSITNDAKCFQSVILNNRVHCHIWLKWVVELKNKRCSQNKSSTLKASKETTKVF